jgi:hypothetical protein
MATAFTVKQIIATPRPPYVVLAIETHEGQRFTCAMSAREHASILGALIRSGLDVEESALRSRECEQVFRAALVALEGSDTPQQGRAN